MNTREVGLWTPSAAERDGLQIEAFVQPAVNLALVHNGVQLVRAITVRNTSEVAHVDVTVTVTLHRDGEILAEPWTRTHEGELAPGAEVVWTDFGAVHPSQAHLGALNESHPAGLRVLATRTWGQECQLAIPIRVLAHNEWFNAPLFYSSLAAFVQPNTRAVQSVLSAASELLRKETGDASLGGYQGGSERAAVIAASVYEALRQRNLRYSEPPASFEDTGQKVRTAGQVLQERLGTCIDLSVTYASCLEQAGLRALLWLVEGHAFAGFMLDDEAAVPESVVTEPNAMANLVRSGRAVAVEASFYGAGAEHVFAAAVGKAQARFERLDSLRGLIVVPAVRRDGVRPLPSLDDVAVEAVEVASVEAAVNPLGLPIELQQAASTDDVVLDTQDRSPSRVRQWKRSLLDLSTRNRLLNLRPSAQVIDLEIPVGALPELEDLVHAGKAIRLRAQDALGDLASLQGVRRAQDVDPAALRGLLLKELTVHAHITSERYQRGLRTLQRTARTLLEETGNANLYLTFGTLVHTTTGGKEARAPLFLVPARLEGGTGRSEFRVSVDPSNLAAPNHCLVEWLRLKHNVRIPALDSPKLDDSGLDIPDSLRGIRAALVDHNLDFRIDEVASLAICQFSTFGMWRDLDDHWDVLSQSPVVRHLALHPGESFRDGAADDAAELRDVAVDDSQVAVPIPADGSQLKAVTLAAQGRTFVLEGPPGTGKSQTITNLIAHALDEGKTVLFVAEKQAALEVVKRRLEGVGLGGFALDLHGNSQQPKQIREQLKNAMDTAAVYEQRGWELAQAKFRSRHAPLDEYPDKVHDRNGLDFSLWTAAAGLQKFGPGPVANIATSFVRAARSDEQAISDGLQGFARTARSTALGAGQPWALVGQVVGDLSPESARDAATNVQAAFGRLAMDDYAQSLAGLVDGIDRLGALAAELDKRVETGALTIEELERVQTARWRQDRQQLDAELTEFFEQHDNVLGTFKSTFAMDGDLATLEQLAGEAQKGLFGKKKKHEQFLAASAGISREGRAVEPIDVQRLGLELRSAREHAVRIATDAAALLGPRLPRHWSPLRPNASETFSDALTVVDSAVAFATEHPVLNGELQDRGLPSVNTVATLRAVADAQARWLALLGSAPEDYERWLGGRAWLDAWRADVEVWAGATRDAGDVPIRRWAQMIGFLDPLASAGLNSFREQLVSGAIPSDEAEVAFLRGTAAASVRERRSAGGLEVFEPAVQNGGIDDFAAAAAALREEQQLALPAKLAASRSFQPGRTSGRAGELRTKLDSKRNAATFRQLIGEYGDLILEATPCLFVSPASLAQFVPPGSVTFDLVVFDEASQVTVPQAIGALGRGRSAVIVGDSQQMPPTAVGKASAGSEDGDEDEAGDKTLDDLESILTECVESGFPRLWLTWHYRSQHESLIAFSNAHYYDGNLASLPSPGGDPTTGVEWRRVNGHFNREDKRRDFRTNRVEADAIFDEVRRRLSDPELSGSSIGVVTFNAQQRDLVLNLLEESGDPLIAAQLSPDAEEGLFVKNLENVQGDERDVILFSTAFSRRPEGTSLPMNFGPISGPGGEKRLNVAVTRARRKVVMFTSFDPTDIDLGRTRSRGMADLRAYIEMAGRDTGAPVRSSAVVGRDEIAAAISAGLQERGLVTQERFGLSEFALDLVVREQGAAKWQVAVILDGPVWARRATASDRDLMPRLLTDIMAWGASVRVWLPQWLDDSNAVLDQIEEAISEARLKAEEQELERAAAAKARALALEDEQRAALDEHESDGELHDEDMVASTTREEPQPYRIVLEKRPREPVSEQPRQISYVKSVTEQVQAAPPPEARDFHAQGAVYVETSSSRLGERADLDRVNSGPLRATIADAARQTVEQEGPIEASRLARQIARRFGFDRVPAARSEFILSLVPPELTHTTDLGSFVWPTQIERASWRGHRATPEDLHRPLSDIAPEEIINAMAWVLADAALDDPEQLFRETLAIFGQRRMTSGTRERFEACLRLALASGRLTADGGLFRPGL